ncbi:hypothetical protein [Streptomyces sp. cmx-18-6]|uniref:hypothetical protein n=1 Tax=Streptomyces sp. cmx-18-6 TaxID=2790930 RepID=UPI00397EE308
MTQSGQGGEQELPAGRPAHEGVVLPADGGAPWHPGAPTAGQGGQDGQGGQAAPAGGQPWGRPWGPQSDAPQQPDPQAPGTYGYPPQQQQQGQAYGQVAGAYQQPQHSDPYQQQYQPQPPQQYQPQQPHPQHSQSQPHHPQSQHPQQSQPQPQSYAQPLPPEAVPGAPGGDVDATQYIAPVPGGAGPGGMPQGGLPQPGGDADATQYIPPVPGGAPYGIRPGAPEDHRQPPAEFDNLFRTEEPAGSTQQMPRFDAAQQPPRQGYPAQGHAQHPAPGQGQAHRPQQPYPGGQLPPQASQGYQSGLQGLRGAGGADEPPVRDTGDAPRRRAAHIPLIAAVVVGCAVVGLGAGALLSTSGDDKGKDDKQPVASQSSPAQSPTTKAAVDPAKPQAEALDKLLADSNNSRAAVISAVEKIKSCKELDQANTDLRDAAQQRRDLVTRLDGLTLDKLPQHAALTSSLTRAWKASAAADEHYATWARQAKKSKHVCKGGQARSTNETARANRQSGEATKAKQEASGLWNAIAQKYGLTTHTPVEL